jgi:hypothetical protein
MQRIGAMTRRAWLSACVSTGLLEASARSAGASGKARPDSRDLVATPAKRAQYLQSMLRVLCTELGPRPSCSEACERGALIIKREMERALPVVRLDTFTITGWALQGEPELRIGGRRLETYLAQYGPGTPQGGVRGVIRKRGPDYEIVDGPSGRILARIDIGPFGPAVVSLYRSGDGIPRFGVGRQDVPVLDRAANENLPVFAKAQVRTTPDCKTSNVAGVLPGDSSDEILYVAHADTVYVSPGASDNTASMITMLMLAHGLSGTRPKRTMTFLASTAEEGGSRGAKHYAAARQTDGTLTRVKVCVNLDSLTYGPNLQITTTDRVLQNMVLEIHRDLGIKAQPKLIEQDDTMDSAPFRAAGARTIYFNSRGYDARTLPLNHRPDDRADTIDPELVEQSYRILLELTRRMQSMPL